MSVHLLRRTRCGPPDTMAVPRSYFCPSLSLLVFTSRLPSSPSSAARSPSPRPSWSPSGFLSVLTPHCLSVSAVVCLQGQQWFLTRQFYLGLLPSQNAGASGFPLAKPGGSLGGFFHGAAQPEEHLVVWGVIPWTEGAGLASERGTGKTQGSGYVGGLRTQWA